MSLDSAADPLGVYVHIPFCEAKCTYCHFAIDPRRPDAGREERYVRALLAEIQGGTAQGRRADTLYFGGGTPSLLRPDSLSRLMEAVRRRYAVDAAAEVTLEANPRDLDLEGYRERRALGVTRLSLGLQHFDADVLRDMGRLHGPEDSRAAVRLARQAGLEDVSLDLILGWSGETRERWRQTLEAAGSLVPDHVSLYVLEVEGRTLLQHRARRGGLALPADDLVADLYLETVDRLAALGLERYEISNFARPGRESRHNGKYWDDAPFLGFGMSAHSYLDGRRFWNADTLGGYCLALEGGGPAVAGERRLSAAERVGEALFTGLRRRQGVALEAFRLRYGVDLLADYAPQLRDPLDAGLLDLEAGRLRLTPRGVLVSSEVFQAFV